MESIPQQSDLNRIPTSVTLAFVTFPDRKKKRRGSNVTGQSSIFSAIVKRPLESRKKKYVFFLFLRCVEDIANHFNSVRPTLASAFDFNDR